MSEVQFKEPYTPENFKQGNGVLTRRHPCFECKRKKKACVKLENDANSPCIRCMESGVMCQILENEHTMSIKYNLNKI